MSEVRFTAEPTGEAVSADALRRLAGELGVELGARMGGGEIGAWTAMDFAGREVVVKVAPEDQALRFSRAVEVASVLSHRGVGIPGPCQWGTAAGLAYILQPKLRGVPPAPLHLSHARRICEWWLLFAEAMGKGCSWISPQDGKSGSPAAEAGPFGCYARTMLTDGYGLDQAHGNLQIAAQKVTLDGSIIAARAAEELLGEIASVGAEMKEKMLREVDAMHWDLHHGNLLVEGDELVAVVDWDSAWAGDARYDLVVLDFWAAVHRGGQVSDAAADYIADFSREYVDASVRGVLSALYGLRQLSHCAANRPQDLAEITVHVARHLRSHWLG